MTARSTAVILSVTEPRPWSGRAIGSYLTQVTGNWSSSRLLFANQFARGLALSKKELPHAVVGAVRPSLIYSPMRRLPRGKSAHFSFPLFSPKFPQAFLRGGFRERTTQWDSFKIQPNSGQKTRRPLSSG